MSKSIVKVILVAALALGAGCGCTTRDIQPAHNTNAVPMKAFNDEVYVWESWQFSTNEVNNIVK